MADFKNFNGYDVKDEVARLGISSLQSQIDNIDEVVRELGEVDVIDSQYITGRMIFASGFGYSSNIIEIDLSNITDLDKYNYVNLIGLGMNLEAGIKEVIAKIEIPRENGRKNLSSNYPCYAYVEAIIPSYVEKNYYYGSVAFEITRVLENENNKLQIRVFNTPLHVKERTDTSNNTTIETLYDSNGSMIVSGGASGMYSGLGGIGLSVF